MHVLDMTIIRLAAGLVLLIAANIALGSINAIIAVAEKGKPFNRYYIGSGEPKPLREFLLEMRDLVDPAAEIGLGDLPFKGVNVSYDQFDLKKVERDTGYVNQIPFAQGIKMTADYIREEA